jgi:hypothetical protein
MFLFDLNGLPGIERNPDTIKLTGNHPVAIYSIFSKISQEKI